jgi:hypothetical protein
MMFAYAVVLVLVEWYVHRFHPTGMLLYGLAILPAIPSIGIIAVVGLFLMEVKDEFQRTLLIQSMVWGVGGFLSLSMVWGFLQIFAHVPDFPMIWTLPLFSCTQVIALIALKWRYR